MFVYIWEIEGKQAMHNSLKYFSLFVLIFLLGCHMFIVFHFEKEFWTNDVYYVKTEQR